MLLSNDIGGECLSVTLTRETEDVKVDIDFGKEWRANKIYCRQFVLTLPGTISFENWHPRSRWVPRANHREREKNHKKGRF
ncbi:hypothetical protein PAHAL_9G048000 [Panicum hallii]|uniref:Uncharacterized protein n=1 Tax=Panicum hallii TaxID=206008 RepID=A0A2T8I067_9POAL|nr:hypothetical protein PAHAL_9G048000 [Panicum hallii]